jgi:teichuronic acid biosynthesis protein TuaE
MLAAGIGFYLVLQTGSRAYMVALMPMAVVAAGLYLIQYRWKALRNLTVLLIAFVLMFCFLKFTVPEFDNWSYRQYSIACRQISSLNSAGSQESARVVLIRNSVTELKQHSLMGVGAGNAEEHMKKYLTGSFDILALHNWWLEILVNYGFFIFILYLTFYCKLLHELFVVAVRAGPGLVRLLGESSLLALVGFPVAAFSSSSLIYSRFMWIIFGIALCAVNIYRVRQLSNDKGIKI